MAVALEVVQLEGVTTENENRRSDDDDGTSDCGNPGNHTMVMKMKAKIRMTLKMRITMRIVDDDEGDGNVSDQTIPILHQFPFHFPFSSPFDFSL